MLLQELDVCDCAYCNDGEEHLTESNRPLHLCEAHGEYVGDYCAGCTAYERRIGEL